MASWDCVADGGSTFFGDLLRIIALLLCCLDATPGPTLASRRDTNDAVLAASPHRGEPPGPARRRRNPGLAAAGNSPRPVRDRWRQAAPTRLRSVALEEGDDSED